MVKEIKDFHIAFGLKSGIPRCCVDFWVNEYCGTLDTHPNLWMAYHNILTDVRVKEGRDIRYVPCPSCLSNRVFVKTIECSPDDAFPYHLRDKQKHLLKTNYLGYATHYVKIED